MDAPALAIRDLLVVDRGGTVILQVPEFTLTHGEVCGIYGASVDGANLFLNCVSGLCRPTGGSIRGANRRSRRERTEQVARVASSLALDSWMQTPAKQLPGGVQQRLALA